MPNAKKPRKRAYESRRTMGTSMSNKVNKKAYYENLKKNAKINRQKNKDAKLCIGCQHNDGGFCRYSNRWCTNARIDKACEKLK